MDGLIAVHAVTVLQGRQQVTIEPGSPLPVVPEAEGKRLLALGAVKEGIVATKPGRKRAPGPDGGGEGGAPAGGDGQGGGEDTGGGQGGDPPP